MHLQPFTSGGLISKTTRASHQLPPHCQCGPGTSHCAATLISARAQRDAGRNSPGAPFISSARSSAVTAITRFQEALKAHGTPRGTIEMTQKRRQRRGLASSRNQAVPGSAGLPARSRPHWPKRIHGSGSLSAPKHTKRDVTSATARPLTKENPRAALPLRRSEAWITVSAGGCHRRRPSAPGMTAS
jgi:hypothetical protein